MTGCLELKRVNPRLSKSRARPSAQRNSSCEVEEDFEYWRRGQMRSFDVFWSVAVDLTGNIRSQESSGNIQESFYVKLCGQKRCKYHWVELGINWGWAWRKWVGCLWTISMCGGVSLMVLDAWDSGALMYCDEPEEIYWQVGGRSDEKLQKQYDINFDSAEFDFDKDIVCRSIQASLKCTGGRKYIKKLTCRFYLSTWCLSPNNSSSFTVAVLQLGKVGREASWETESIRFTDTFTF